MQGLWALRPIADLDMSQLPPIAGLHPESAAKLATDQRAAWTDQQLLAQSAGAACSAGAPSAGTPSAVDAGTRVEQLARTQGVIGAPLNHVQPAHVNGGTAGGVGSDTIARERPQPLTQTPPPLPPPPPEQQHQGWPTWFLQWAHRVKDLPDQPPGPSAPPSAPNTPPSPPDTPQRSMVKVPQLAAPIHTTHPPPLQRHPWSHRAAASARRGWPLQLKSPEAGLLWRSNACPTPPTQPDGMQPIYNPPPLTMQAAENPGPPRPVGGPAAAAVGAARAHGPNPRHDPLARQHDPARGAQPEPRPPHAATVLRRPRRRTDALRAARGGL